MTLSRQLQTRVSSFVPLIFNLSRLLQWVLHFAKCGFGWVWIGLCGSQVQYRLQCYVMVMLYIYIYIYIIVLVYVHRDSIRESVLAQDLFMTRQERQDALRRSLPMLGMQLEQFFVLAHLLSFFLYYLVFFQKWSQRS